MEGRSTPEGIMILLDNQCTTKGLDSYRRDERQWLKDWGDIKGVVTCLIQVGQKDVLTDYTSNGSFKYYR